MAELADAQDLGSCAARRMGSTPITRTKTNAHFSAVGFPSTASKVGICFGTSVHNDTPANPHEIKVFW